MIKYFHNLKLDTGAGRYKLKRLPAVIVQKKLRGWGNFVVAFFGKIARNLDSDLGFKEC